MVSLLGLLVLLDVVALAPSVAGDRSAALQAGDAAMASGAYATAVKHYSDVIDADPSAAFLYTKRATAYIALRQNSQAMRDLDRAIEADATHTNGYLQRGKLSRQLCDPIAARIDFESVLRMREGHKGAIKELALLEQLEAALAALDQAVASNDHTGMRLAVGQVLSAAPDCGTAQLAEARVELEEGNHEQAAAITGRILKSSPGNVEALMCRGLAYYYMSEHDLAKRHFGEALKYDPDHKESRRHFNRVKDLDRKRQRAARAVESGALAEAEELLLAALSVDPKHSLVNRDLYLELSQIQRQLGKANDALSACSSALALGNGNALAEQIRVLMALGRWDEAVVKAKEALHANQGNHEFHQLYQEAERGLKISKRKDYYKMLGVAQGSELAEIKRAYKTLARQYHPDKATGTDEEKKAAEQQFLEIAEAYEVLSNDDKRAIYDRGDDPFDQQHQQGHPGQHGQFFQQGGQFFHQGGQQFHFQWG